MIGKIVSINVSKKFGTKKIPIKTAILKKNAGLLTDTHFVSKRPVSLLSWDDVEEWKKNYKHKINLKYGIFAENISFVGFSLRKVKLNKIIFINKKIKLKIIQIGKKCHTECDIKKITGSCIMPKYGIFAKVLSGGKVSVGDIISIR